MLSGYQAGAPGAGGGVMAGAYAGGATPDEEMFLTGLMGPPAGMGGGGAAGGGSGDDRDEEDSSELIYDADLAKSCLTVMKLEVERAERTVSAGARGESGRRDRRVVGRSCWSARAAAETARHHRFRRRRRHASAGPPCA